MPVTKAVILAAGFSTRVLPYTKAVPKEMIQIADKPAVQHIAEELSAAGITDILIITGRGREALENHFDHAIELEMALLALNCEKALAAVLAPGKLADFYFLRQKQVKGVGNAVLSAKSFIGTDPFILAFGDEVILPDLPGGADPIASDNFSARLISTYIKNRRPVVGVCDGSDDTRLHHSLALTPVFPGEYNVSAVLNKTPTSGAPGMSGAFAQPSDVFLGRCLLTPDIFDALEHTPTAPRGEIEFTHALNQVARLKGMTGINFQGFRCDLSSVIGVMRANVEATLRHPEYGGDFKEYLVKLVDGNINS